MIYDKTIHHPLRATKAFEYTTLQTQHNKRSFNGAIRIIETP